LGDYDPSPVASIAFDGFPNVFFNSWVLLSLETEPKSAQKHRVLRQFRDSKKQVHYVLRARCASASAARTCFFARLSQNDQCRRRIGAHRLEWSCMEFTRITTNPRQMGGVPCVRGLRIPVATVVALVAEGQTPEQIVALYPDLEPEDIREALLFAAEAVRERALPLAAGE
jgi:uncharacterized protein (DUF433 family)